jgi:hypothetical protein
LNDTIVYVSARNRARKYFLPQELRPMAMEYFHDSALSAHLGAAKTLRRVSRVFYWPGIRVDVIKYVRQCEECQRAKPAHNIQVGFHSSQVVRRSLERVFIDFVGPIVRSRRGNIAVLVILDGFSKSIGMYPVRKITSGAVVSALVEKYFPCFRIPCVIVSDNAAVF